MTDNQLILLGLTLGLCVCCFGVTIWAICIAVGAWVELRAFKKSTHTIQYMDPAQQADDLQEKMTDLENKYYEGDAYEKGPGGQAI